MRRFLSVFALVGLIFVGVAPANAGIIVTVGKIDNEDGRRQTNVVRLGEVPVTGEASTSPPAPTPPPPTSTPTPQTPHAGMGEGPAKDGKGATSCPQLPPGCRYVSAGRVVCDGDTGGSAGAGAGGGLTDSSPVDDGGEIAVMGCEAGSTSLPVVFGFGLLGLFGLRRRSQARASR